MTLKNLQLLGLLLFITGAALIPPMMHATRTTTSRTADIDGNVYKEIAIGGQTWMQENLNVSCYRNGEPVRHAKTDAEWLDAASRGEGAWCYYNNDPSNGARYGRLYNWYAINDPRGLAPEGWRIPNDGDWETLIEKLGGEALAGGKMKTAGNQAWADPNQGADGSSRFDAQPGGIRGQDGTFRFSGLNAFFWSNSEFSPAFAWYRSLGNHRPTAVRSGNDKLDGLSVRCIRE